MPQYEVSWRVYGWPFYREPGQGHQKVKTFEAVNDQFAIQAVQESGASRFRGHEYHREAEEDYRAEYELKKLDPPQILSLPEPDIIQFAPKSSQIPHDW